MKTRCSSGSTAPISPSNARSSTHAALTALAVEAGLDEADARAALAGDAFADAVNAEIREARGLGISGVPYFVIDRRYAVSGAQPPELFAEALTRAQADARRGAALGDMRN